MNKKKKTPAKRQITLKNTKKNKLKQVTRTISMLSEGQSIHHTSKITKLSRPTVSVILKEHEDEIGSLREDMIKTFKRISREAAGMVEKKQY